MALERILDFRMKGEDVSYFQKQLQLLRDLGIPPIPENELQGQIFDDGTQRALLVFKRKVGLDPTAVIDQESADRIDAEVEARTAGRFVVRGKVRYADGRPLKNTTIRGNDVDLRNVEELFEVTTDDLGNFVGFYSGDEFSRAEKGTADLQLCHCEESGRVLFAWPTIFNIPSVFEHVWVVNGEDYRGPSEYEELVANLTPLLQGLSFDQLEEVAEIKSAEDHQDITFLHNESGEDPRNIAFLILAHRLNKKTRLAPEIFYGLFRNGLSTHLQTLLAQSPEVLKRALNASLEFNIIPATFAERIEEILEQIKQLTIREALKTDSEEPSLGPLLATVLNDRSLQETFLKRYAEHSGDIEDFWQALRDQPEFTAKVDDLQFALQSGTFSQFYMPLVLELQRQRSAGDFTTFKDLVRYDEAEWKEIISRDGIGVPQNTPGKTNAEKQDNFSRSLTHLMEDTFPTAFMARRLEKEDIDGKDDLLTFFKNNESFDITTTRWESHLLKHPEALADIGEENLEVLKQNIKTFNRLYKKIVPRFNQVMALKKAGIHSSYQITRLGPNQFDHKFGDLYEGETISAKMSYENAEQSVGTSQALLLGMGLKSKVTPTKAVPESSPEEVDGIPDWQTLFGSLDLCECQHCRSVFSPAAYLVDILHYLKDRNVKGVLFQRRPDIGEIELTCENTNTPLPYVDLVIEILENYIAPLGNFSPFSLPAGLETDLENQTVSTDLQNAFTPQLSEHAVITVNKKDEWWSIDDLPFTYNIRKEGNTIQVVTRGLQTRGTAEEILANPQYINVEAYKKLRGQVFPWKVPFDIWAEEVGVFLEHLRVKRHEIMEAFLPGSRIEILDHAAIAHEYLGLMGQESNVINGTTTSPFDTPPASAGLWHLWGFSTETLGANDAIPNPANSEEWITSGNWLDELTERVDVFLQQSGLTYKELLDLLTTKFINPQINEVGAIFIAPTEPDSPESSKTPPDTCELDKLKIFGFDQPVAERFPRFVRLWRHLGWSIWDLDRALQALTLENTSLEINDDILIQLSHIKRLHERLKIPIDRLVSFWAPLDTAIYIDHHKEGQPRLASVYATLFRNKTVINPLDIAFTEKPENLNSAETLSDHGETIASALKITVDDFTILIAEEKMIPSISGNNLTLDNLSRLHRHSSLAKALKLRISDYVNVLELTEENPFSSTLNSVTFVEQIDAIKVSDFDFAEINYLLRHEVASGGFLAPADDQIAIMLDELRADLKVIYRENTFNVQENNITGDANTGPIDRPDEWTKKKLALLNWDSALIDEVIATFNDTVQYQTPLGNLPGDISDLTSLNDIGSYQVPFVASQSFIFPAELNDIVVHNSDEQTLNSSHRLTLNERTILFSASNDPAFMTAAQNLIDLQNELQGDIAYDSENSRLSFIGVMTQARQVKLKDAFTDANFQDSIDALFDAPRNFISRNMRRFSVPNFESPLTDWPENLLVPTRLNEKFYFDEGAESLHFIGTMSQFEREALLSLSSDMDYQSAVEGLFIAPETQPIESGDDFLSTSDPDNDLMILFDVFMPPSLRFEEVLKKLLPHLRKTLSEQHVVQKMAEVLKLEDAIAADLLTQWVHLPDKAEMCMKEFLASNFVESSSNQTITRGSFSDQYDAFVLLHKIAIVVSKFEIELAQIKWLFAYRLLGPTDPTNAWLDLNALPLTSGSDGMPTLESFRRLVDLFDLRDKLPQGETILNEVFEYSREAGPTQDDLIDRISKHTNWDIETLKFLAGPEGLDLTFPTDFQDEQALGRLINYLSLLKRLGISANLAGDLGKPGLFDLSIPQGTNANIAQETARNIKQAVRAKYDEAQWLKLAPSLRDDLREKQRVALVAYLISHPDGLHPWRDSNDVYAYFLIDVEMSPCQMTSRIKQANSAIQLFVQRCLMNLEPDVEANAEIDVKWLEWKWMKNYRVWEANRKVLLHPENFIEPELRDNKSPFFKEMQDELLQSDLTKDSAEKAFLQYLEKLDQVAKLEIAGMYHQIETDQSNNKTVDVLHVFGRTSGGDAPVYYYRKRVDDAYWTAWERVSLEIPEQQIIPVIWNRRLYLFWPVFKEVIEERDVKIPLPGNPLAKPPFHWELGIAWSKYQDGRWSVKKTSKNIIDLKHHGSIEKNRLVFKAEVKQESLNINCYLVASKPSTLLSRSEIFNIPRFKSEGCWEAFEPSRRRFVIPPSILYHIKSLPGSIFKNMFMVEESSGDKLYLQIKNGEIPVLNKTPGNYKILYPHQDRDFYSQRPFFFQDEQRAFFVVPRVPNLRRDSNDILSISEIDPGKLVAVNETEITEETQSAGNYSNLMKIEKASITPIVAFTPHPRKYCFQSFYHPYVCDFMFHLRKDGVDGLLRRSLQLDLSEKFFKEMYDPTNAVETGVPITIDGLFDLRPKYPKEEVDFSFGGAYSLYNWELFFHVPLIIAQSLMKNQRFEEAQRWYHFIFNPTDASKFGIPERYWQTKPFHQTTSEQYKNERVPNILRRLASRGDPQTYANLDVNQRQYVDELEAKVRYWRKVPFMPHAIARMSNTVYQKTVVMKYLENLIAWGDQLFRRDTMESINEATQLYILASEILGKRPEEIPPRAFQKIQTFNSIEPKLGDFSNALVQIEEFVPPSSDTGIIFSSGSLSPSPSLTLPTMLYFCAPKNDKLLGYWDTVGDRLFKIRNCMNIQGVVRQLALFAPPIDPGLLVKAAAAGIDIGSALNEMNAPLPHYRFTTMAQKANELCNELKSLGGALLSALEKKDAEELSNVRASHESALLKLVENVKKLQFHESNENINVLKKSREAAVGRYIHYQKLLGIQDPKVPENTFKEPIESQAPSKHATPKSGEDGTILFEYEIQDLEKSKEANEDQLTATDWELAATAANFIPEINTSPFGIGASTALGAAFSSIANRWRTCSTDLSFQGSRASKLGQFVLRSHDWLLQSNTAAYDIMNLDQQILVASIQKDKAEMELENHGNQIQQAQTIENFLRDKFTNNQLYHWMIGKISGIYFQAYQLAYDVAKRSEMAYRHELGLKESNFIQFGYWDSLRKGLLAGERLHHDLKRMEVAYLDQNKREYEITKHISIAQLDPLALQTLKKTGECYVNIPEALFDLDCPGHFMRRIKSVAITCPCVTGPFTSINCTLSLIRSSVRHSPTLRGNQYARDLTNEDLRFTDIRSVTQSVVTSNPENDSGTFETNLRDERYLPFEGAGVISSWRIVLPKEFRQFNYDTISDFIMHFRYTAREAGGQLKQKTIAELQQAMAVVEKENGLQRMFSARQEFSSQWHAFLHPVETAENHTLIFSVTKDLFPSFLQGKNGEIQKVALILILESDIETTAGDGLTILLTPPGEQPQTLTFAPDPTLGDLLFTQISLPNPSTIEKGASWSIQSSIIPQGLQQEGGANRIDPKIIKDMGVIFYYTVEN